MAQGLTEGVGEVRRIVADLTLVYPNWYVVEDTVFIPCIPDGSALELTRLKTTHTPEVSDVTR